MMRQETGRQMHLFLYLGGILAHPVDFVFGNLVGSPIYKAIGPPSFTAGSFSNLFFTGSAFFIFSVAGALFLLKRMGKKVFVDYPLLTLLLISSLLSFGYLGGLHILMSLLPFWRDLHFPFKLTLYSNFFIVLFGAQSMHLLINSVFAKARRSTVLTIIVIIFALLMVSHVVQSSQTSIAYYHDDLPLQPDLFDDYKSDRIATFFGNSFYSTDRLIDIREETSVRESLYMGLNFPSYYGTYSIGGYEPLRSQAHQDNIPFAKLGFNGDRPSLDWLSEWNVRWIFVPVDSQDQFPEFAGLTAITDFEDEGLIILENPEVKSFVNCDSGSYSWRFLDNGIEIISDHNLEAPCSAALLHHPKLTMEIDGKQVPLSSDELGRTTFTMPAGHHVSTIQFKDNLFTLMILISMIAFVLLWFMYNTLEFFSHLLFGELLKKKYLRTLVVVLIIFFAYQALTLYGDASEILNFATACIRESGLSGVKSCLSNSIYGVL